MQEFRAGSKDAGLRADVFVASKYPNFTRSSLGLLFDKGLVQMDGVAVKASHKMEPGDKISVDETYLTAKPPQIDLPIVYEDDDVLVINKPAAILTHSKGALNLEGTVASFIANKLTDDSLTGNRAGIVHRLDRATSGLIITAKNATALSKLQKQFSLRKAKKTYLAVVEGIPDPAQAIIDAPIERNPKKPQTFRASGGGKPAQTQYLVLKAFSKDNHEYALLELKPKTGRTHQLRVHLAYIGHPIVGDRVYGHDGKQMLLQAKALEITLPNSQRRVFQIPEAAAITEFMSSV